MIVPESVFNSLYIIYSVCESETFECGLIYHVHWRMRSGQLIVKFVILFDPNRYLPDLISLQNRGLIIILYNLINFFMKTYKKILPKSITPTPSMILILLI